MSKKHVLDDFKPRSLDDLFGLTSTSTDINSEEEKVVEVDLKDLYTFNNHPFSVLDDDKMEETVESIKEHGVLVPGIVRRRAAGGYELISGHRRRRACELAGLKTMPVFIRDLSDDEATIVMVDSNIQREEILPSEKAKAYKMKYEALKHQGKADGKGDSLDQLGEKTGDSRSTIQRYIKIADMNEDLLGLIDDKKMGMSQGVELASLSEEEQEEVYEVAKETSVIPSLAQSSEIKDMSRRGEFSQESVKNILEGKPVPEKEEKREEKAAKKSEIASEEKKEVKQKRSVSFEEEYLERYFPESYTEEQIRDVIDGLLDDWKKGTIK